jgi:hypothetical protein
MGQKITDTTSWADMCSRDHFVQFYDDDTTIVEAVAGYFAFGLRFNETCVLVGTAEHNTKILDAMRLIGADVAAAVTAGRLKVLDAAEMLDRFMVGGLPDKTRFNQVIGTVIPASQPNGNPPRVFGEMVALLVERRNPRAALALEKFWNELAANLPFRLFCAYRREAVARPGVTQLVDEICATHSQVMGLASA